MQHKCAEHRHLVTSAIVIAGLDPAIQIRGSSPRMTV
jgi:hypothetical protein